MFNALMPYLAQIIFSQSLQSVKRGLRECKRRLSKQPHQLTIYLAINDPYSYVLIQVLPEFLQRFNVTVDYRTVLNKDQAMFPAPLLWQKNALQDSTWLAQAYQLCAPKQTSLGQNQPLEKLTAQLLHWELQPDYLSNALALFHAFWQQNDTQLQALLTPGVVGHVECYEQHLAANEKMLKDNGHYLSAMVHYAGEWYWGLDRLFYLEQRLNHLNVFVNQCIPAKYTQHHQNFNHLPIMPIQAMPLDDNPLELYWSIRSPYSYLALVRSIALAKRYQLPLIVKPVLPMVMRRMLVPKDKTAYISQDANREAGQYGIAFGRIADPLGKGVENCYALFDWAKQQGKELAFLESYAKGVWSEGVRSETSAGLKKIVQRAGLDWQQAKCLLANEDWRIWAQQNLSELYGLDLWGVPSFHYVTPDQDVRVFGQDRLNVIEAAILKNKHIRADKNQNGEKNEVI